MVLSKEEFVYYMKEVKKVDEFNDKLNTLFSKYGADGCVFLPTCADTVLTLLHRIMEDTEEDWISYFCFELDFGKKYKPGTVLDSNGAEINLSTIDSLYDFLVKNK